MLLLLLGGRDLHLGSGFGNERRTGLDGEELSARSKERIEVRVLECRTVEEGG